MTAEKRPLLELEGLRKAFGGLVVIDDLDLVVHEREIVSVIGPNGAGKTSLFNVISGLYAPDSGEIKLDGESLLVIDVVHAFGDRLLKRLETRRLRGVLRPLRWVVRLVFRFLPARHRPLAPHEVANRGVARTFQTLRLFLNMSVIDNVMASQYGKTKVGIARAMLRTPAMRREERAIRARAEEKLAFFGQRLLGYRFDMPAYSLSYANRRRLEIARAMATEPRILLLDEPAAGMNPVETHEITELIGKLRDEAGYTILVIEHDMHVVEGISDRVVALDHGVKIAEGTFGEVATNPRVVEAYLGTKAAATK
ncbi:MAG: branched-chain amino acid transport system ATP-binding protein [Gaiellaceae bacterium]|nr:branched-chain amino acid transport system ATP-binding protein [Gaiellaceae bacterium]